MVSASRVAAVVGLVVVSGCASLLDIKDLREPADGGASPDGGGGCPGAGVANVTRAPRAVHTAVDETDVYFTRADPPRDSAILRCAKCGCDAPTEIATRIGIPGGIAVDDRYVYWTEALTAGTLVRVDKRDPTQKQTLGPLESPVGVTVDDAFVYFTVLGGGPNGVATAGVYRARKDDFGDVTRLAPAGRLPDDIVPYAIAVDATHVYWTTAPDLDETNPQVPCMASFGTIRRADKRGGFQTSERIATGQACPMGIALDDTNVYWVNLGAGSGLSGSVATVPKAGGGVVSLAGGEGRPTSITLQGGRLTWTSPANQRLLSCTARSCSDIATLASNQRNPSGLSSDATGIYWAVLGTVAENFADGAVRRAASP